MIRLTWGQIKDPRFLATYQRLQETRMPWTLARKFQIVSEALQKESGRIGELWPRLQSEYLEEMPGSGGAVLQIKRDFSDEAKAIALDQVTNFNQTLVEINEEPIAASDLGEFQISPIELSLMKGLLNAECERA